MIAAAAGLAVVLALGGCATRGPAVPGSGGGVPGTGAASAGNGNVDLGGPLGGRPAPDFTLVNQFSQPMSLSQFRGKVVLLSFDDAVCTTVCPLTTQEMLQAKRLLGAAGDKVQLLGVDANPDATSTADVMAYSRARAMVNQWDFLTGTKTQLAAVWKDYAIYAQIEQGVVDHTPALFLIDQQGREQRIYLTAMAYSSIDQQAQVLARQISRLLPGHPVLSRQVPLSAITGLTPRQTVTMPAAASDGTVTLAPGRPHLVVFFATWLSETSNLAAELADLNAYARRAWHDRLPPLTAVDEEVTEPGPGIVRGYLRRLGSPLAYPVGMDTTGRVADGYGVQDQPWYVLTAASGKIAWSHDGWLSWSALRQACRGSGWLKGRAECRLRLAVTCRRRECGRLSSRSGG
jgi:cytochrome oxidase Cu insertion factor (SCO1/SenC/PrrC family)